jgi:hypothetical protein
MGNNAPRPKSKSLGKAKIVRMHVGVMGPAFDWPAATDTTSASSKPRVRAYKSGRALCPTLGSSRDERIRSRQQPGPAARGRTLRSAPRRGAPVSGGTTRPRPATHDPSSARPTKGWAKALVDKNAGLGAGGRSAGRGRRHWLHIDNGAGAGKDAVTAYPTCVSFARV